MMLPGTWLSSPLSRAPLHLAGFSLASGGRPPELSRCFGHVHDHDDPPQVPLGLALPSMLYRLWTTRGNTEKLAQAPSSMDFAKHEHPFQLVCR